MVVANPTTVPLEDQGLLVPCQHMHIVINKFTVNIKATLLIHRYTALTQAISTIFTDQAPSNFKKSQYYAGTSTFNSVLHKLISPRNERA
jgi:hypothetical protein